MPEREEIPPPILNRPSESSVRSPTSPPTPSNGPVGVAAGLVSTSTGNSSQRGATASQNASDAQIPLSPSHFLAASAISGNTGSYSAAVPMPGPPVKQSSVSFTVPDLVEKSHRGSISARPSSLQISTMGSTGSQGQQGQQTPTLARLPSGLMKSPGDGLPKPSVSRQTSLTNQHGATPIFNEMAQPVSLQLKEQQQQHTPVSSNVTLGSRNPSIVTNGSDGSSRQNSTSNLDFIQFTSQNFGNHPSTNLTSADTTSTNPASGHTETNRSSSPTSRDNSLFSYGSSSVTLAQPVPTQTQPSLLKKKEKSRAVISTPREQIPFYEFFQKQDDQKIHILIGATGSVATIKVPLIIDKLYKIFGKSKLSIQLVVTKCAEHFLEGLKISTEVKIWRDDEEWYGFKKMGDAILHQELRKWADIMLIAPLSANTLAKMANGICDNLLTSIIRSWNPQTPMLVAPAMNTFMYTHPLTKKHLNLIAEDCPWIEVLKPVEKVLICGDIGMGGMREWSDIVEIVHKKIKILRNQRNESFSSVQGLDHANTINEEDEEDDDENEDGDDDDDNDDDDDDDDDDEDDDDDDDEDDDGAEEGEAVIDEDDEPLPQKQVEAREKISTRNGAIKMEEEVRTSKIASPLVPPSIEPARSISSEHSGTSPRKPSESHHVKSMVI